MSPTEVLSTARLAATPGCPSCDPGGLSPGGSEVLRCSACTRVFVPTKLATGGAVGAVDRARVPRPVYVREFQRDGLLSVRWGWPRGPACTAVGVATVWNLALYCWLVPSALHVGGVAGGIGLGFLVPLLVVGVSLGWWALRRLVNGPRLVASRAPGGFVAAGDGPLPGGRSCVVETARIDQLFVQVLGLASGEHTNGSPRTVRLVARDPQGIRTVLLQGLRVEEALWLEQRLEEWLAIVDRPVGADGETR